jgi:two-component system, cell cycle response regulator
MKVMVVEDEPASSKLVSVVLAAEGHSVTTASTAEAAFESVKADKPDVLLLDLLLPGMDGLGLARLLKGDPSTERIRIIALTAFPDVFHKEQALSAGCHAFLVKPVNTRTLVSDVLKTASDKEPAFPGQAGDS